MAQKKSNTTALVIQNVELTEVQKKAIGLFTPKEFVKERKGKGGKVFSYVETGYVVARLTQAFGPLGWSFIVKERIIEANEVAVLGVLTFRASNGTEVTKSQWGQAQRLEKMALGDALKAASSDALKKSASLLGVALDVYWPMLDMEDKTPKVSAPKQSVKKTQSDLFEQAKKLIAEAPSAPILNEWKKKLEANNVYNPAQKKELIKLIDAKIMKVAPY